MFIFLGSPTTKLEVGKRILVLGIPNVYGHIHMGIAKADFNPKHPEAYSYWAPRYGFRVKSLK